MLKVMTWNVERLFLPGSHGGPRSPLLSRVPQLDVGPKIR
jgi:hypothetical protein